MTLPEELLLLCAEPGTGLIKPPKYFTRTLSGAVLAELALHGAVVLQDDRVTEIRPLTTGDPVADRLLTRLIDDVRQGMPGLHQVRLVGDTGERPASPGRFAAARQAMFEAAAQVRPPWGLAEWVTWHHFRDLDRHYPQSLQERGLLTATRRRTLGVLPRTAWTTTLPDHAPRLAARITQAFHSYGPDASRDLRLAALAGVAELTWRLFPGPRHADLRHRVERLAHTDPIALAVRKAVETDERRAAGPD